MLLVVAWPDLALRLSKRLMGGGVSYVVNICDAKDLRRKVHEYQPDVMVLDTRIGGSAWRAIDEVPAIVSRTSTHPYVIAVLPWSEAAVEREAARRDCYDVVSVDDEDFDREFCEAVETAIRARASRRPPPRRLSRGELH